MRMTAVLLAAAAPTHANSNRATHSPPPPAPLPAAGSHEFGHQWAGRRHGITFYLPFVIPAGFGFLGSFGTLTRPQQILPSREAQLDIAVRGPLLGAAVSLALALAGFALSGTGLDPAPVTIDSPGFLDSLLMATLAQAFLGDALAQPEVKVSALMLAGWAGLVVNALACVPAGELDGGRIAVSLFGRRAGQSLGSFAYLSMAVGAFSSALAFYYIGLTLFLQRGPLLPCSEEVSAPKDAGLRAAGLALLALPLLVLLPYPVDLMAALAQLGDPVPF